MYAFLKVFMGISWNMMKMIEEDSVQAETFGLSTIPGPSDGFTFYGMKSKTMNAFYTTNDFVPHGGMMVCSLDNKVNMTLTTYRDYIENPDEYM